MTKKTEPSKKVREKPVSTVRVEATFLRIILSDMIAAAALILPLAYLGITLFTIITGDRTYTTLWLGFAVLVLLIGAGITYWRVRLIQEIIKKGFETEGTITKRKSGRGNVELRWNYQVDGKTFNGHGYVDARGGTQGWHGIPALGEPVALLVHPRHPDQSVLRDLYAYTPTKPT